MSERQGALNRRGFTASMCAAASLLPAGASASVPPVDAAKEVEQIERRLVAAISAVDLPTYDQLVADDYVVVQASGAELTKAEVMASYRSGARRYKNLVISEVKAHLFGDTAVVAARTTGFRREGDGEVPNNVRYVRVYVRRQGKWRAVAQMATPIPTT
jgi:ketosteroid isomerase-like protein